MSWLDALQRCRDDDEPAVLVTIRKVRGSAPRNVGTRMVVTAAQAEDSIGGGELELEAMLHARAMLAHGDRRHDEREYTLGRDCRQCCGGVVTLGFEFMPVALARVHVFGCGHVAQELARLLVRLPLNVHFHDTRSDWRTRLAGVIDANRDGRPAAASATVTALDDNPYSFVEALPRGACYLVMTHSHEHDFELVEAILAKGDSRYCGLIASRSKATRFCRQLQAKGFAEDELAQLTAPLGSWSVQHGSPDEPADDTAFGDNPMAVALAVMRDLAGVLRVVEGNATETYSGEAV